jgi:plasmid stabilization system protein ParE
MRTQAMPRGDKSKYTGKQERKADHIAESYEHRGVPSDEAERRAWATVNKDDGGGKKSGSGRGAHTGHPAAHKGGEVGGKAAASRPAAKRSASARKAAATRQRNSEHHAHS